MNGESASSAASHRAGYVALVGRPNVGKSTLMNALLETHLAITSRRPQTTRRRVTGILHGDGFQVVLVDTPGVLRPSDPLQRVMMGTVDAVLRDVDAVAVVVDASRREPEIDPLILSRLQARNLPAVLVLNKIDRVHRPLLLPLIDRLRDSLPWREIVPISARKRDGTDRLRPALASLVPVGPPLFPPDELSEEPVRFFVAEFVREQLVRHLAHELPYAVSVLIEEFRREPRGRKRFIRARIVVARESQRGIVLGRGGAMIKRIGVAARRTIEGFLREPVFLELRVKVEKNWKDDPEKLGRLGYRPGN